MRSPSLPLCTLSLSLSLVALRWAQAFPIVDPLIDNPRGLPLSDVIYGLAEPPAMSNEPNSWWQCKARFDHAISPPQLVSVPAPAPAPGTPPPPASRWVSTALAYNAARFAAEKAFITCTGAPRAERLKVAGQAVKEAQTQLDGQQFNLNVSDHLYAADIASTQNQIRAETDPVRRAEYQGNLRTRVQLQQQAHDDAMGTYTPAVAVLAEAMGLARGLGA
ncbi:MAG: hypothetical protein M1826_003091 [Phylliscum demangeonii]|nr:MAG: hypothetical protein M1826_003091 [Phylliscum demangeonii]